MKVQDIDELLGAPARLAITALSRSCSNQALRANRATLTSGI